MSSTRAQYVASYDNFEVLKLTSKVGDNRQFSMYILLPEAKDSLWSLAERLSSEPEFLEKHMPVRKVVLVDSPGEKSLRVSSIVHKCFVEVDEEGTEAAAACAINEETIQNGTPIPTRQPRTETLAAACRPPLPLPSCRRRPPLPLPSCRRRPPLPPPPSPSHPLNAATALPSPFLEARTRGGAAPAPPRGRQRAWRGAAPATPRAPVPTADPDGATSRWCSHSQRRCSVGAAATAGDPDAAAFVVSCLADRAAAHANPAFSAADGIASKDLHVDLNSTLSVRIFLPLGSGSWAADPPPPGWVRLSRHASGRWSVDLVASCLSPATGAWIRLSLSGPAAEARIRSSACYYGRPLLEPRRLPRA
ncbi:hypothetical protein EJB05_05685, partial [Eragrostis curvula]